MLIISSITEFIQMFYFMLIISLITSIIMHYIKIGLVLNFFFPFSYKELNGFVSICYLECPSSVWTTIFGPKQLQLPLQLLLTPAAHNSFRIADGSRETRLW